MFTPARLFWNTHRGRTSCSADNAGLGRYLLRPLSTEWLRRSGRPGEGNKGRKTKESRREKLKEANDERKLGGVNFHPCCVPISTGGHRAKITSRCCTTWCEGGGKKERRKQNSPRREASGVQQRVKLQFIRRAAAWTRGHKWRLKCRRSTSPLIKFHSGADETLSNPTSRLRCLFFFPQKRQFYNLLSLFFFLFLRIPTFKPLKVMSSLN